jgi:Tfp pilus assembly protein PilO
MGIKEDFQELSPAKCLVIGLLLCVVYYFALFDKGESVVAEAATIQTDIDAVRGRLRAVKNAMNNKVAFEGTVVALTKDLEDLLKFFPLALDMNDIQRDLTDKLKITENKLVKISEVEAKSRFPGYVEYGVELEVLGGFHEIMGFLSAITKMNRVVDVRAMSLRVENANDEFSMITFKITLSVFGQEREKLNPDGTPKQVGQ